MFFKRTRSNKIAMLFLVVTLAIGLVSVTGQSADEPRHWADIYTNALYSYEVLPVCAQYTDPDYDITLSAFMIRIAHLFGSDTAQTRVTPLARWEVAAYIQEAFRLEFTDTSALYYFADYHLIPEDARAAVSTLVSAGIMSGHDSGRLDPLGHVTHAQASALLMRTAGTIFSQPGEFAKARIATNALINTGGVNISDTVIDGRLFITEGANNGKVRLTNVTTDFALVRGASRLELIESNVYAVDMYITTGDIEVFAYPFTNFLTAARSTGTIYLYGHYLNVIVLSEDVNVVLREGATIGSLYIMGTGRGFHITIDGSVEKLWAQANNGTITGTGHIQNIEYLHPDIKFEIRDDCDFKLGCAVFEDAPPTHVDVITSPSRNNNDSSSDSDSSSPGDGNVSNNPGGNGSGGNSGGSSGNNNGSSDSGNTIGEVTRNPGGLTFIDDSGKEITIPNDRELTSGHIKDLHYVLIQLQSGDTIKTKNGIITEIIANNNLTLNGSNFTPQNPIDITLGSSADITITGALQDTITIIGTNNNNVGLASTPGGTAITVGGSLGINSQNLTPLNLNLMGGADINLTLPSVMGRAVLNTTDNMQPSTVSISGTDIAVTVLEHVPYALTFSVSNTRLDIHFYKNGHLTNMSNVTSYGGNASVILRSDNITFTNISVASIMGRALENVIMVAQNSSFPHSSICEEQDHSLCGLPTCLPPLSSLNIDIYPLYFYNADAIYSNNEILCQAEEYYHYPTKEELHQYPYPQYVGENL